MNGTHGNRLLILQVICGSFAASVPVYPVVAWVMLRAGNVPGGNGSFPLPAALGVAGVLLLVAAHALERTLLVRAAAGDSRDRLTAIQLAHLVGFVLREAAVICGFVATLLSADLRWSVAFAALAALAMAAAWPTPARVRRVLARSGDAIEP